MDNAIIYYTVIISYMKKILAKSIDDHETLYVEGENYYIDDEFIDEMDAVDWLLANNHYEKAILIAVCAYIRVMPARDVAVHENRDSFLTWYKKYRTERDDEYVEEFFLRKKG